MGAMWSSRLMASISPAFFCQLTQPLRAVSQPFLSIPVSITVYPCDPSDLSQCVCISLLLSAPSPSSLSTRLFSLYVLEALGFLLWRPGPISPWFLLSYSPHFFVLLHDSICISLPPFFLCLRNSHYLCFKILIPPFLRNNLLTPDLLCSSVYIFRHSPPQF